MDGLAPVLYQPGELSREEPSTDASGKVPHHCTEGLTLDAQVFFSSFYSIDFANV